MPETLEKPVSTSQSPSTDRTLDILEVLSDHAAGMTLSELVRTTELPQNSVFRITNTLVARGYLHRRESDKRFMLSNRLLDLGRPRVNDKSLVVCAFEALRQLRDETGETTQLLVRSGRKVVVLEQVSGQHPVKVMGEIGLHVPMYSCAPGKAILANLPESELESWLASVTLKSFTPNTLASRDALLQNLARIRQLGFATDLAEGLEGIHCISAPVRNEYEYPIAAVTMMAPVFRLPEDQFAVAGEACIRAAKSIENRLRI